MSLAAVCRPGCTGNLERGLRDAMRPLQPWGRHPNAWQQLRFAADNPPLRLVAAFCRRRAAPIRRCCASGWATLRSSWGGRTARCGWPACPRRRSPTPTRSASGSPPQPSTLQTPCSCRQAGGDRFGTLMQLLGTHCGGAPMLRSHGHRLMHRVLATVCSSPAVPPPARRGSTRRSPSCPLCRAASAAARWWRSAGMCAR